MHVDEIRKEIFPMQEFYSTSLNLTQPIFPKDLEKISINGGGYLLKPSEKKPIELLELDDDQHFSFLCAELWHCDINFRNKSITAQLSYSPELTNGQWADMVRIDAMHKGFSDLTPVFLIDFLYVFHSQIQRKLILAFTDIEFSMSKALNRDCLYTEAYENQYESSDFPQRSGDDLPF